MIIAQSTIERYYSTVLEKVQYCYNHYPLSIESDERLLFIYEQFFGKIELNSVDSIKRAGRSLRHDFPERYNRTADKAFLDSVHSRAVKNVFARS